MQDILASFIPPFSSPRKRAEIAEIFAADEARKREVQRCLEEHEEQRRFERLELLLREEQQQLREEERNREEKRLREEQRQREEEEARIRDMRFRGVGASAAPFATAEMYSTRLQ